MTAAAHGRDVRANILLRFVTDNRPQIGGEPDRVPDLKLVHGAPEHRQDAVGSIILQT
jgi:hypothetical protein